ncbi:MAG: D-2-hydroxyacid dehydrogenase family protein [Dehalococcoidia bacterium]
MTRIAILNDYQGVALSSADWSVLGKDVEITVFREPLPEDDDARVSALQPFDVLCLMRERTPLPGSILRRLPNLKLIATAAMWNRTVDLEALKEMGVLLCGSPGAGNSTVELTWALLLACARNLPQERTAMGRGEWQTTLGADLSGHTLGLVGLGNLGGRMVKVAQAFGMEVIAWSQNLTRERAVEVGARLVTREEVFSESDFVSIHLVLGDRSRGLVQASDLQRMKPTAYLINTSRGPIVNEAALLDALRERRIAGAGLDVYDIEPLSSDHPLLQLDNVVLTPHLGFVTRDNYRAFYGGMVECIRAYLDGAPIRVLNP